MLLKFYCKTYPMHVVQKNMSSRFSSNSEANVSELRENLKEMLPIVVCKS